MGGKARRLAIGLAILGIFVLAWTFRPRERLLMEQSHRVAALKKGNYENICYWLPDDRLLLLAGQWHDMNAWNWQADQIDLKTGLRRSVTWLAHLLNDITGDPSGFCLSPDGKRLLWYNRQTMDGWGVAVVAELDGSRAYHWDADRHSQLYWIDSTHWAEDEMTHFPAGHESGPKGPYQRRLVIYDVRSPHVQRQIRPHSTEERAAQKETDASHQTTFVTDQDYPSPDAVSTITLQHFLSPGYGTDKPLRSYTIAVPQDAKTIGVEVAPQGDRVAYQFDFYRTPPIERLLHRFLPTLKVRPQVQAAIWLSRIDGSDMHEVGHVNLARQEDADEALEELQWLPDGKKLSFIYKNTLYTVPAGE